MVAHHGPFSSLHPECSFFWTTRNRFLVSDVLRARTFIVRMRLERDAASAAGEWRGEIERVPDGARGYFREVEGVVEALRRLLREVEQ